ncbi:cytochrome d ubiquinol oxidase subunit II [Patescibacteria group bacterium]|nr:cytochrome d ubiquinol oxidase subunit II [Patescibacteria group bacterium]
MFHSLFASITAPDIAYGVGAIFLFLYLVLSSIEFGAALYLFLPEKLLERETIRSYVNPIWETTNIFLIFFVMILFTCFPKAMPLLSPLLFPVIYIALVFFIVRIIGILGLFYGDSGRMPWRLAFFVGSWGAALTLSNFYHVMVTGMRMPWPLDVLSISLILLVITTILLISSTFFLEYTQRKAFHPYLARLCYFALLVWYGAAALYLTGPFRTAPYALAHLSAATNGFIAVTIVALSIPIFVHFRLFTWSFLAACTAFGMLFFGSVYLHLPYLVYPSVTVTAAFTSVAVFHSILISGAVGFIFLIPALFLLYWLFALG